MKLPFFQRSSADPGADNLRAAQDPATPPEKLRELCQSLGNYQVGKDAAAWALARAITSNPNAPLEILLTLSLGCTGEFLRNPVLPLLLLEAPDLARRIPEFAALRMTRFVEAPIWLVQSFANRDSALGLAARLHISVAGPAGDDWPALAHAALSEMLRAETQNLPDRLYSFTRTAPKPTPLLPEWMLDPLREALGQSSSDTLRRVFGDGSRAPHKPRSQDFGAPAAQDVRPPLALARRPDTSPATLAMLAANASERVRQSVARHQNTPPNTLAQLSSDTDFDVRRTVARNAQSPLQVLEALSQDENSFVRGGVARNTNAPPQVLATLARDEHPGVRFDVARHESAPRDALESLSQDPDGAILDTLLRRRDLNPELRARIEQRRPNVHRERTWRLPKRVARDPRTPAEQLAELSRSPSVATRVAAISNPNLPVETLVSLARAADVMVINAVARCPRTPPELLSDLARSDSLSVQQAVASNPSVPLATLRMLVVAEGKYLYQCTQAQAASNPALPVEEMPALSALKKPILDYGLAQNPRTPPELLGVIAKRAGINTLKHIAQHPNLTQVLEAQVREEQRSLILQACLESNFIIQRAAELHSLKRPARSDAALLEAMQRSEWLLRLTLARHPKLPREMLQVLAGDGNRLVRAAAQSTLDAH